MNGQIVEQHRDGWSLPSHIGDARGAYDPMRFVVRLNDEVHAELSSVPVGVGMRAVSGPEALALATYFHETIHWWQHVGSTLGLFLSLSYPLQTHIDHTRLKVILRDVGAVKSLLALNRTNAKPMTRDTEQELNIILNNWHDIEFCRWLALSPERAPEIVNEPYFDSVGHAYNITWANAVVLIRGALDPTHSFLPNPHEWEPAFQEMRDARVEDYYYGSPVRLSPIGARPIFEGQARFCQIQSIHFGSPDTANWSLFDALGMLNSYYTTAFKTFLKILGLPWPASPGGPEVGLFLAICDVSINPTEGFPYPITDFASFRANLDPGLRFIKLCQTAATIPELARVVQRFTLDEYEEVTETLTRRLSWRSPLQACATVRRWEQHPTFRALELEDAAFRFAEQDLPVRLFVARYLDFQRDKLRHPELLVWPGAFMGSREHGLPVETVIDTFARHGPLFVDVPGGEVRPALIAGRDQESIYETFNSFYAYSASYELVRQ
jgi:hypothetical protein